MRVKTYFHLPPKEYCGSIEELNKVCLGSSEAVFTCINDSNILFRVIRSTYSH